MKVGKREGRRFQRERIQEGEHNRGIKGKGREPKRERRGRSRGEGVWEGHNWSERKGLRGRGEAEGLGGRRERRELRRNIIGVGEGSKGGGGGGERGES